MRSLDNIQRTYHTPRKERFIPPILSMANRSGPPHKKNEGFILHSRFSPKINVCFDVRCQHFILHTDLLHASSSACQKYACPQPDHQPCLIACTSHLILTICSENGHILLFTPCQICACTLRPLTFSLRFFSLQFVLHALS